MTTEREAPYLAFDTSTSLGSVALGRGGRLIGEVVVGVSVRHSEALLPAIDYILESGGLGPRDLAALVVGGGPGSFTGLRVAGATAKGLLRVLGIPLYSYSGLLGLAATLGTGVPGRPIAALFDARRGEVYAGVYTFSPTGVETHLEPTPLPVEALLAEVGDLDPIYLGDGALRYAEAIEKVGGQIAPPFLAVPRASGLLWLAETIPEAGRVEEVAAWEPEYIRDAGAVRKADR